MSLNSVVSDIGTHLKNAYDAVEEMGGELPEQKNFANLAAAVESIPSGGIIDPNNVDFDKLSEIVKKGLASRYLTLGEELATL